MISPLLQVNLSDFMGGTSLADLMASFPEEMRQKALRYRQVADQYRYVLGRKLLQNGVGIFGRSAHTVLEDITYSDLGKPLLPELWFSITHSGEYVFCLISDEGPVGLDVEAIRPMDHPEHLQNWFTPAEWEQISGADDPLRTLYHRWTQKEAILKAVGCGLRGLEQIRQIEEQLWQIEGDPRFWRTEDLQFGVQLGVVGHCCWENKTI